MRRSSTQILLFILFTVLTVVNTASAQLTDCKAELKKDTLIIENSKIKRTFIWNEGALKSVALYNKTNGEVITGNAGFEKPDMQFPGLDAKQKKGSFKVYEVAGNSASYPYLAAEVVLSTGGIEVKRIFKIYSGSPAIGCDYYVRGKQNAWKPVSAEIDALKNIEDENTMRASEAANMVTDKLLITGSHWKLKAVEFYDASDYNNNMVQEYDRLLYRRENKYRGNLMFAKNQLNNSSFFILKEAPVSGIQLQYLGYDFTGKWGDIQTIGIGIAPTDISETEWTRGYSVVVGIPEEKSEIALLKSLRSYQSTQRIYKASRDEMILSNTWGDRNRDSRIKESFILQEIEQASKLGISYVQIDDGWEVGKSSNSAGGGSLIGIWRNPHYWDVDTVKFPGKLYNVIEAAKKKNIKITLWFNPSPDSSFKNWEKDADALIKQYHQYGITMWKIDGVQSPDKQAEINFRKFLDKVTVATNYEAVFNLDVTAGRRFGYHYMHTYGNLFLENRYTDWTNYYPHFTLRNLWQLSKYVPAQRFQIEFLNKWRNQDKYRSDDFLAPANYSFDYLFAISMFAQPLAWFEITSLPQEAFKTSALVAKYKTVTEDLHKGQIFPIGEEPTGLNWTGFVSQQQKHGYLLVFRENNSDSKRAINTLLPANTKLKLSAVAGDGKDFATTTDAKGNVTFSLAQPKSFALYKYSILP